MFILILIKARNKQKVNIKQVQTYTRLNAQSYNNGAARQIEE